MTDEKKHDLLINAFQDEEFKSSLEEEKKIILESLEKSLENFENGNEQYKTLFSIESRIKSCDSFEEKIYRKNYIQNWCFNNDIESAKECIRLNLPDLIGFRINCYFQKNEKIIYDWFKDNENQDDRLHFNFNENTRQKNGHDIYKFTGKRINGIKFEVQIKSVMHNVWGEVEHKTVYKNRNFNNFINSKKKTTDIIWEILQASDKQLVDLYNAEESDEQLIRALFFNNTKERVKLKCKTDILANHYARYFKLFQEMRDIKKYVVLILSNKKYRRNKIILPEFRQEAQDLATILQEHFPIYNLKCLYQIDLILHIYEKNNKPAKFKDFLEYIANTFLEKDIDNEFDLEISDDFNSEENEFSDQPDYEDYITKMDELLGGCRI